MAPQVGVRGFQGPDPGTPKLGARDPRICRHVIVCEPPPRAAEAGNPAGLLSLPSEAASSQLQGRPTFMAVGLLARQVGRRGSPE